MKLVFLSLVSALVLSGCNQTVKREYVPMPPTIQVVKVPVAKPWPQPPVVNRPHLPISELTEEDKADKDKVIKATTATVQVLIDYSSGLENTINVYRVKKK